jgi:hypothetical protein
VSGGGRIEAGSGAPFLHAARRAATFLREHLWRPESGTLLRRYRRGQADVERTQRTSRLSGLPSFSVDRPGSMGGDPRIARTHFSGMTRTAAGSARRGATACAPAHEGDLRWPSRRRPLVDEPVDGPSRSSARVRTGRASWRFGTAPASQSRSEMAAARRRGLPVRSKVVSPAVVGNIERTPRRAACRTSFDRAGA